jgi:heterodisulfide reductase subunit A
MSLTRGPRIGVLICDWAGGREGDLDLPALKMRAEQNMEVDFAAIVHRVCSPEGRSEALALLKAHEVDRFVVAACSPRTKGPMFRRLAAQAGLHPLSFEVVNLREQCAYVHHRAAADGKARRLLDMALAKMMLWVPPPFEDEQPIERKAAVIGNGLAAGMAAYELAAQGIEVDLIMSTEGFEWPPEYLFESRAAQQRVERTMTILAIHPRVNMVQAAHVIELRGRPGDFEILVQRYDEVMPIKCGVIVLAPHSEVDFKVLRAGQLRPRRSADMRDGTSIVILPSGTGGVLGCNCISARTIRFAQTVKERAPSAQVMLMGREIRALGTCEAVYEQAQKQGILFTRVESQPMIEGDGPFILRARDASIGELRIKADTVMVETSAAPQLPSLARMFGVPMDEKGDFLTLETRLRGAETVRRGVFACRVRLGNMMAEDSMLEARAAASGAASILVEGKMEIGGEVAEIDEERCSACLTCLRTCPYGAPVVGEKGKAAITIESCQGCGMCAALCPSKAIGMYGSSDAQLSAQARAAILGGR